ncbi:hypothetical protein DUNSADRAFT_18298 [Dunaliella salina]|uniref:F-box domain-containing protein n=1 Tax=Dunaliella salina TaxID=3046 RepID=A0ABQ7G099_DUNSA|nr:hypothetical protein DUNSADRAFT_18298 [Dunaliella salina]|eukprot:KAF5828036.1 hypothetical protein DUNSADRAFT_18298 [Dunaliella salina]
MEDVTSREWAQVSLGLRAEQNHATRLENIPQELLALIFFRLPAWDRCNFHNSCKAIKENGEINERLRKLVLGCEGAQEELISQIVTFPRALEHLVLCSRLPITSGFREMHILRDPEPLGHTLIKLADAAYKCEAARERLAALRYLTLQGWIVGSTQRSLNGLLNLCPGLQELNFLACAITPYVEAVLKAPSPSAPQLQSLRLHACTLPQNNSLNFASALTSLTTLSLRVPRASKRPGQTFESGEWSCTRVDLSAVSKLVSLRTLVCVRNEDDNRSHLPQPSGPLRCNNLGHLARCCTNLTHLEFGLGDVGEPSSWELNSPMYLQKLPSLRTLALPCASPSAILALLQPRSVGQTLRLQGETCIRLPAHRASNASLQGEAHGEDTAGHEHGEQIQLLAHPQQQQQQQQQQQHLQGVPAFHQQQLQQLDHYSAHMRAHMRQHRTEFLQSSPLRILQANDEGEPLEEAAAAIAENAHPEAATHLSLKPLVRDSDAYDWRPCWRMCDAGILLMKLSPLASHVKHLCLGQMCLGVEGDADTLVFALPRLQTLRLENCKLKASVPRHWSAEGHELAGKDSGLAVILKGLTSLTRVDLIRGSIGEEEDLLDAAAKASGLVSDARMRFTKLPQLHLVCEDLEAVDPGRSMAAWSQRQDAYQLFEGEPMRVKLRVKA